MGHTEGRAGLEGWGLKDVIRVCECDRCANVCEGGALTVGRLGHLEIDETRRDTGSLQCDVCVVRVCVRDMYGVGVWGGGM